MNIIIRGFILLIGYIVFITTCYGQVSFITNGQNITSDKSWDIRLVDIDGDKDLDAYFEGKVWLNDGNGLFTKTTTSFGGNVYFADLNGDGKVDVVCNDSIYLNDGAYHYNFHAHIPSSMTMNYAQPVDIDSDGDIDIIVADQYTDSLFINDGTGNFTNAKRSFGGWGQCRYAFGDINGDGTIDVIVGIPHTPPPDMLQATNKIWLRDNKGDYILKNLNLSPDVQTRNISLADFDKDGDLDLLITGGEPRSGSSFSTILLNDGSGNFSLKQKMNKGFQASDSKLADFDNDGDIDIFFSNGTPLQNGCPNTIWLNGGKGNFIDSKLRLGNSNSIKVDVGDINGDGKIDAVVANVKLDAQNGYTAVTCPVEIWLNKSFECNYLNETKPGATPVIFGKGTVSIEGKNTHACTFSPDGKMLIFSRYPDRKSYIMTFNDGRWTDPVEAFFEGKETSFSADGKKVFYYKNGGDIYYSEKTESGWGKSISVGTAINTSETEYYPSVTGDRTLFFSRNGKWSEGRIMYSTYRNGKYNTPVDIGLPVNTGGALHAYVAPDKSYMIFNSPRAGSYTKLDLWISFRNENGSWTNPKNMGKAINSWADAILCPTVTPDGNYLFFTKLNFNTNTGFIYWVSSQVIEEARIKAKQ
jgi:hypothetical protein